MGVREVAAGAAWLDENFPGWEREIDLGTLDLESCSECICGQSLRKFTIKAGFYFSNVEVGYDIALAIMGMPRWGDHAQRSEGLAWAGEHGFYEVEDEPIWRELIKERFNSGNLSDG